MVSSLELQNWPKDEGADAAVLPSTPDEWKGLRNFAVYHLFDSHRAGYLSIWPWGYIKSAHIPNTIRESVKDKPSAKHNAHQTNSFVSASLPIYFSLCER